MYSPLSNITYETDQFHNRQHYLPQQQQQQQGPCSPYAPTTYTNSPYATGSAAGSPYAGTTPSPYASSGSVRPVYGPSMATHYQQFYDVATGAPLSFEEEQQQQQQQQQQPISLMFDSPSPMAAAAAMMMRHANGPYMSAPKAMEQPQQHPQSRYYASPPETLQSPSLEGGCPCVYCTGAVPSRHAAAPMMEQVPVMPTPTRQQQQQQQQQRRDVPSTQADMTTPVRRQNTKGANANNANANSGNSAPSKDPAARANQQRSSPSHAVPTVTGAAKFPTPLPKSLQHSAALAPVSTPAPVAVAVPEPSAPAMVPAVVVAVAPSKPRTQAAVQSPTVTAAELPLPSAKSTTIYYVEVAGHHNRVRNVISYMPVEPGAFVVCEGDRGEDLAQVLRSSTERDPSVPAPTRITPMIVRSATAEEVRVWSTTLVDLAAEAVTDCNDIIAKHGLALTVRSASFQLDKAKITLFYECEQRVDFRRLLIEMFNKYRCRIWMERL